MATVHPRVRIIRTLFIALAISAAVPSTTTPPPSALQFDVPLGFSNLDDFEVQYPSDSFAHPNIDSQRHTIDLTADSGYKDNFRRYNVGRLRYINPLSFPYGRFPSFTTSFTFLIETDTLYNNSGDGIAFALTSDADPPINSTGRFLGLTPEDTNLQHDHYFVAVEFDTFQNFDPGFHDPSGSHIGIDVNNLASSANFVDTSPNSTSGTDFPQLYLYNNYTIKAWIEYDAPNLRIRVWATNVTLSGSDLVPQPPKPCLEMSNVNLSEKIPVTELYAVITAASGNNSEGHVLYAWNFSSAVGDLALNSSGRRSSTAYLFILVAIVALEFLVIVSMAAFIVRQRRLRRRRRRTTTDPAADATAAAPSPAADADPRMERYSYLDFQRACDGFSTENVVGEGGWGIVYRGKLGNGTEVAVKKMKKVALQKDFYREVRILTTMDHPNLLPLLAWRCWHGTGGSDGGMQQSVSSTSVEGAATGMLLVYPYMKNGSLEDYVGSPEVRVRRRLGGARRLEIVCQVAAALEYLHGRRCVHRDVKPSNVLLTEGLDAKVGDFGLARIGLSEASNVTVTEMAAGTPGYMAPELIDGGMDGVWRRNSELEFVGEEESGGDYAAARQVSYKTDVYSFGVLALRVASAEMYTYADIPRLGSALQMSMDSFDHRDFVALLDPTLREGGLLGASELQQWRCVFLLALRCLSPSPAERPSMAKVSQALHALIRLRLPDILDSLIFQL